jgi:7-carboxy-7-deazaguanine synthase
MNAAAAISARAAGRDRPAHERLRLTELFCSLQGEGNTAGLPTVFVRLTGCPLRCVYCDTTYAFHGGTSQAVDDVVERVADYGVTHVCVTGGEPLAQYGCPTLLQRLCDAGHKVALETSGALDVRGLDPRVVRVVDFKTPGSGEVERNRWDNVDDLGAGDQVKFVLCDRHDYEWAKARVSAYGLDSRCEVLFSPVWEQLAPRDLADWVVADRLPVRVQLQLHKILWGDEPGR